MKTLRLILGDQLNLSHSWFRKVDDDNIYCLFEVKDETTNIRHHIKKIGAFFSAMRCFAEALESEGHKVEYIRINDSENRQSFIQNLNLLIKKHGIDKFEYQLPDNHELDKKLAAFCDNLNIASTAFDTEHFLSERFELKEFFEGKKLYIMENFYRHMRQKHDILMQGDQPEGGKWNFDKSNRNKWKGDHSIPEKVDFKNDISEVLRDIRKAGIATIGRIEGQELDFPISREQALAQLEYFCNRLLIHFGDYQDAMHTEQVDLFHSRISFALNAKLISPGECINASVEAYQNNDKEISVSQVEGFVRQILGWREYMRGMYWAHIPEFRKMNALDHNNKLPEFYWTGKTKMNCLKNSIDNSLDHAYAHHIQRLMITGNFALLNQTDPDQVDEWYLGIYADALEWVQITNTRGMSQYADGGLIATKPYISSANYVDKMSNYCKDCHYDKKSRTGEKACPFNSLYWNFLDDHRSDLSDNRRMGMMFNLLDRIPSEELKAIKERANQIMLNPDDY